MDTILSIIIMVFFLFSYIFMYENILMIFQINFSNFHTKIHLGNRYLVLICVCLLITIIFIDNLVTFF